MGETVQCSSCGANLEVQPFATQVTCEYCDTKTNLGSKKKKKEFHGFRPPQEVTFSPQTDTVTCPSCQFTGPPRYEVTFSKNAILCLILGGAFCFPLLVVALMTDKFKTRIRRCNRCSKRLD